MAILYPSETQVNERVVARNKEGEAIFLEALIENLDDSFEIYYKPFLNGDMPDIVILRKGFGAYVIEIKGYDLNEYEYKAGHNSNDFGHLIELSTDLSIPTPYEQVEWYKNNLYNTHTKYLTIANLNSPSLYSAVKTAIFFAKSTTSELSEKFDSCIHRDRKYIKAWGSDSLDAAIESIKYDLGRTNSLCAGEIFDELRNTLMPKFNETNSTNNIHLSSHQKQLSQSKQAQQIKITGPTGSGKTVVLAKRAINAYERTGERVLVLCYSTASTKYIEDKISYFDKDLPREMFHIIHFHGFILQQLYRFTDFKLYWTDTEDEMLEFEEMFPTQDLLDIEEMFPKREIVETSVFDKKNILDMDEINDFLEKVTNLLPKYDTILIDEVQDFKYEWLQCIKTYFLKSKGEYVLVGNERPNVSKNKIKTNVKGKWNSLPVPYRFSYPITNLAYEFQRTFLRNKYESLHPDNIEYLVPNDECIIKYHFFEELQYEQLYTILMNYMEEFDILPNDICIVANRIAKLRGFENYYLQHNPGHITQTTFESKAQYDHMRTSQKLYKLRKIKRLQFWMNPEAIKFSTIHHFKTWECDTLVLVLDGRKHKVTDDIIYNALTKCRKNLIIINVNDYSHHEFFAFLSGN
ncbi:MAG: hypothetical protein BEN19_00695 [Epulopiscium sp. Nuni2H_MBin003]|nr:MAG: hypothetical protein BEN19_00695 [Epulopiscium sp. Nuni2H_MBin003]